MVLVVVMLLLFSAAALFAGTKKRVQRERERELCCFRVLFDFCKIFSRALKMHFFTFFTFFTFFGC